MLSFLIEAPRAVKRACTLVYDTLGICAAFFCAQALRIGSWELPLSTKDFGVLSITIAITLFAFVKLGLYRAVLRYMTLPAMLNILVGIALSAATLAVASFYLQSFMPRTVPILYLTLAMLILGTPRFLMRAWFYHHIKRRKPNVLIFGAGPTGMELASALLQGSEYHPVAFIDDDLRKQGTVRHGMRVHSMEQLESLLTRYEPVKILLAIKRLTQHDRLQLLNRLRDYPIEIQSIPSLEDLASGRAEISQIRDLDVEDLLGREPVPPQLELMAASIQDKNVMVTGAGGSIGAELCRQIIHQQPRRLLLFELNEYNLYRIERELRATIEAYELDIELVPALGSVQRQNRLEGLMRNFQIETLYHAAAYKHVPIVEHNIIEGIRNNVFGTWYTAEAAIRCGVKNFVLISTDKAVRPTNVMGASKRMAEMVLQALALRQDDTRFTMVRFGNVLGSSGSVVPLFRDQIRHGGPVTVTHREITRYFMTIPEAAQLVIQAGALGGNGDTFVLDMGEPVKIVDLARNMIKLMGYSVRSEKHPDGDIEIQFTGLRAGEKLYEELLIGDNVSGTCHPKIMRAEENCLSWPEMDQLLRQLDDACHHFHVDIIHQILRSTPTGFAPTSGIKDVLWNSMRDTKDLPEADALH
ncbi:nucleoside-diphosphate sugar epimerase/dehydratase [Marinobacterium arenosum]|uniref:nucleoside-diphosphate sugar epimerase/dehydratase n=1 Tax=Marinobacterium arenosum TaxID=2862496 RepID=UPI001C97973E|nr:nucleoside-diphosphate sugar epimerase/dehydratase [Marinobacterium arenosum]MBY4678740.1 polysaccharide biosynthesis protein [Marinobacterium arenosum]